MALDNFPPLDGEILFDENSRRRFSLDIARNIERMPVAVLQPTSAGDVVKTLQYANGHGLKAAIRGQGHSRYGETLVQGGIVIDSSTLNKISVPLSKEPGAPESIDAQSGAFWGEVAAKALASGQTPPAMGTCPKLSVGGVLSGGGFSNSSHIYGAIADTAEELEVVTGRGDRITCSAQQNRELFEMVLAGMGQCAVIVRARIRLIPAPATVVRQDLFYDDPESFLSDGQRLVLMPDFHHLTSRATRRADGHWIFSINVGKFYSAAEEPEWTLLPPAALSGESRLHFQNKSEPVRASFWDYVNREAAKNTADAASRQSHPRREPSLTMFVPLSAAKSFIAQILASPAELAGLADFQLNPFNTDRIRCPLFRFPQEQIAYGVWLYPRNVPLEDSPGYQRVMEMNARLLERMRAIGGKSYPPYAPYFSPAEWQEHYGPEIWRRLSAAKKEYDPNGTLTPSMRMFATE